MAYGPTTSWQIDGETMETMTNLIFLGSKITADGDCSHEIKRPSLLGRKPMTNLDSILKSRDITLPTKVHLVKAGCELDFEESWALKNWCFWTVMLQKTLESPLDSKEIKPVNPKENQPWIFIELMLKLQYFDHLMWKADSMERLWCWERWKVKGESSGRGWDGCIAPPTQWTWIWANSGRQWRTRELVML